MEYGRNRAGKRVPLNVPKPCPTGVIWHALDSTGKAVLMYSGHDGQGVPRSAVPV